MDNNSEISLRNAKKFIADSIKKEVLERKIPEGETRFYNANKQLIGKADSTYSVTIPEGTAKIVANGNLSLGGYIGGYNREPITIISSGGVTGATLALGSTLIAGGDVKLFDNAGEVLSGGRVDIERNSAGRIVSTSGIKIGGNSESETITGGDIDVGGYMMNAACKGSIRAAAIGQRDPCTNKGSYLNKGMLIKAEGDINVPDICGGMVISHGKVTTENNDGTVLADKGCIIIEPDGKIGTLRLINTPNKGKSPEGNER